jgi:4-carboxymuconolactone decarboxylase
MLPRRLRASTAGTCDRAMTERFTPLMRDTLSPEQQRVFDAILSGPRGAVPAPFHLFLQSAELADRVQQLGELLRYRTGLTPRLSELAILVTARHWGAEYEWSVHEREARKAGVPEGVIRAIAAGSSPEVTGDDALIYDFAHTFYAQRDVPQALYDSAVARFGMRTVVELGSILGYYSMLAIVLRIFRVKPAA